MLDSDAMPSLDDMIERILGARGVGRMVAVHCVTHLELVFAVAAFEASNAQCLPALGRDRIEHGSVITADMLNRIADAHLVVVSQPGFIAHRGARYRREIDVAQHPDLYRVASLVRAGVATIASSDGPYGPVDPWANMSAMVNRIADDGQVFNGDECVRAHYALAGYLSDPEQPGTKIRRVRVGSPADLCLLSCKHPPLAWHDGVPDLDTRDLAAQSVAATFIDGRAYEPLR